MASRAKKYNNFSNFSLSLFSNKKDDVVTVTSKNKNLRTSVLLKKYSLFIISNMGNI